MDKPRHENPSETDAAAVSDRVRRAVAGDPSAMEFLVEWLSPLMLAWVRQQLRSAPEGTIHPDDIVHDVWVRVLHQLPNLRPHEPSGGRMTPAILGFVKRTLRNRVIDVRRQATRRRMQALPYEGEADHPRASSSGPIEKALRSERRLLLQEALEGLSPRDRALYTSRVFEEASLDELCEQFGMLREAVIKARQRVRRRLAEHLGPQLLDDLEPG